MRLIIVFLLVSLQSSAQIGWTWTELDTMPFRTANNAVVEADVNGVPHVFSFGGIDSTKLYSGIHQRSCRYNTQTSQWSLIPDLPDTLGKIAAGASVVDNIIYIMGGYHVLANGNELSSDRVHRYDPETNTYLSDGAPIPVPIDDHVQVVWKDSLIILVTGWSNNGNKPDVQIYNPYTDTWSVGTDVPFTNDYIAFGASGEIIGDTIYYHGGTAGNFSFVARKHLRRGIINPNNPTDIQWDFLGDNPGDANYRSACVTSGNRVFWIGGSGIAYNYDGIAYNGSGGVPSLDRILYYSQTGPAWFEGTGTPYAVMDLRGVAQIGNNAWIICGGMMGSQEVVNRAFLLEYDPVVASIDDESSKHALYPNPGNGEIKCDLVDGECEVYSIEGVFLGSYQITAGMIDISDLPNAFYSLKIGKHHFSYLKVE